ncbi:SDR family oxidoreductase [Phaeovibrio sulfidiphilus]|uniref:SDR family oxidoreductase n=1 Tax=Phaeovibrio sulfidiphilus TaxID=1220600 RepID=A0A8J7CQ39_9PROT|nr:SDR family oxidoreductase [Phaeovibrio sulfidiphilus]MBE1237817.1 SDR family oxidoreductase [Phaeovibrio sulfidiphilus]
MSPHVLITGANRGLGLEFARQYRNDGWTVTATCRNPAEAGALRDLGVEVVALDVSKVETFGDFARSLGSAPVDLFVNNAGVYGAFGEGQLFGSVDVASWQDTFLVNAIAPLKLTEALLPRLEAARAPKAVYVSSLMGSIAENISGDNIIYRTSKTALNMVVKGLSVTLAGRVTVAALHPGWVRTDMGGPDAPLEAKDSVSGMRRVIEALTPGDTGAFRGFDGADVPW